MTTKDIGRSDFRGHPLLSCIDNLRPWRRGGNLINMAALDRITKDDSHSGMVDGRQAEGIAKQPPMDSNRRLSDYFYSR